MVLENEIVFFADLMAIYAIYLIINASLNLEFGFAGIPNFGKVLAVAVGAFIAASVPGRILAEMAGIKGDYILDNFRIISEVNIWLVDNTGIGIIVFVLTLGIAAIIGSIMGLVSSYPGIRLRGDYLAIVLLALGEGIRIIGNNYAPLVGGSIGVHIPDPLSFLAGDLRFPIATIALGGIAAAVYLYVRRVTRSPLGRLLRSIRDDETAAEALGKNIKSARIRTIMMAAALAAVGGALYAFYVGSTIAFAYDRLSWTFWPFVMIIIGGLANNKGVLIGTLVFVTIRKAIIYFKEYLESFVPFDVIWLEYLLLGTILIIVLIYRPQGIFPEKSTKTLSNIL